MPSSSSNANNAYTADGSPIPKVASNKSIISTYGNNRNRAGSSGSGVYVQNSPSIDEDDSYYDGDHDAEVSYYGHGGGGSGATLAVGELTPTDYYNGNKGTGQYDLCGSMWKRRFGLGRNADRNW